jgi:hypothetical protein
MRFGLVMITAFLVWCAAASAAPPKYSLSDHPSQDGRCFGDKGSGDLDRSESFCLKQIAEMAQRAGSGLQLKFRNGLTRAYVNEDAKCQSAEADGCIKYQLMGYFPNHDLMLIEVDHWEGASWLLVRAETGNASELVSPPHYSPNKRWLVSVASSIGPSGPPNGIDIVPTGGDPALKEWHYRVPDDVKWLYEFAGWHGDSRVKLLARSTGTPARSATAFVERGNGNWRLTTPK